MNESNIPCRTAFTTTILEEAKKNNHIFVVTTDSRVSVTLENFAAELPNQFVELGIAEQNAVSVSAGIALCGNNVFVCGPACFYAARSLEQVKVDVAYTYANVKIVGVSGGVSYGALGSTHHSLHDIAVMRTFPGLQVFLPADRFQTKILTRYLAHSSAPAYIRMGRNAVPDIYNDDDTFIPGKARTLINGNDVTIISCGETVFHALEAGIKLNNEGVNARIIDMFSLKPIDSEVIIKAAMETGHILTVEEHSIYGGLGSIVAEIVSQHHPVKMTILGIPDENAINARSLELFDYYGLTSRNIISAAKRLLS